MEVICRDWYGSIIITCGFWCAINPLIKSIICIVISKNTYPCLTIKWIGIWITILLIAVNVHIYLRTTMPLVFPYGIVSPHNIFISWCCRFNNRYNCHFWESFFHDCIIDTKHIVSIKLNRVYISFCYNYRTLT